MSSDVEETVRKIAAAWLEQQISASDALRRIAKATLGGAAVKTISAREHEAALQQRKREAMKTEFQTLLDAGRERHAASLVARRYAHDPQEQESLAHWLRRERRRRKNGPRPHRAAKSA